MNMTPESHLADVLAAYESAPNPRLKEITQSLISHLHAFVAEVGLTRDEWMIGIEALTRTGQMCDEQRQEFILLSDTIGVSMLVEMINHEAAAGSTEPTVFGPFHIPGAPAKANGESIIIDSMETDDPLTIRGTVKDLAGKPLAGAQLDVWQTASNGLYDVQDPSQTPLNMRGVFTAEADGSYAVVTSRPLAYRIPGDGPAGDWLTACGRHNWRPAHTHFVVSAPGHKTVITHLFDAGSDYLDSDAVFGVRDSIIVSMEDGTSTYDFVLEPTG